MKKIKKTKKSKKTKLFRFCFSVWKNSDLDWKVIYIRAHNREEANKEFDEIFP